MKLKNKIKHRLRQIQTQMLVRRAGKDSGSCPPRRPEPGLRLVLLISRSHDIDLYLDIYRQALSLKTVKISFWITKRALEAFPATEKLISKHNFPIDFVIEHQNLKEALPRLRKVDALLNTVESSIAAHKIPHRLTKIAQARGCLTFTLQHAFENIGLTSFANNSDKQITFAARTILTWSAVASLPEKLPPETRQKCIAVGCPKIHLRKSSKAAAPPAEKPIIAIFEGIHADRFGKLYRQSFFADLQALADEFTQFHFILKLHPGVLKREPWQTDALAQLTGIDIIDPGKPQLRFSTPELLEKARAVITTPSTIALDAALAETPAAIIRYRQKSADYKLYTPLPLLDETADWRRFLELTRQELPQLQEKTKTFLNRVMLPGNAAGRILETILKQWHSAATADRR